ncbi:MAG: hypothetical protein L0387_13870 [Acidobacteria bacterium]|nr:hypothetical protein [Acidobacteriota bacterium]MCI0622724.1 hypothetical protein [Acidobacteriota bacterium]MCI0718908.1 hypothetical protein [Acidobacteriota bacterium]
MESQKQSREVSSPNQASRLKFEDQLRDVIIRHLDLLSQDGKEKALDYINMLIDLEQKRLEFNRRQGLLYNWAVEESKL